MHVTPSELRAVRREGVLSRFAVLGPVAFVIADLPRGTVGTSLETPCTDPHWGVVLEGGLGLRGAVTMDLEPTSAFYLPPGPPEHHFEASGPTVVAGFAPLQPGLDLRDAALSASGFEVVRVAPPAKALPPTVRSVGPTTTYRSDRGAIDVEVAGMGPWIHCRATFGSLSGYTSNWCDLEHWGTVLNGDLAIVWEDQVELLTAGDAYYCPPGPPGHRLEVADAATIMDYTPVEGIPHTSRRAEWRRFGDLAGDDRSPASVDPARSPRRDDQPDGGSEWPAVLVATGSPASASGPGGRS